MVSGQGATPRSFLEYVEQIRKGNKSERILLRIMLVSLFILGLLFFGIVFNLLLNGLTDSNFKIDKDLWVPLIIDVIVGLFIRSSYVQLAKIASREYTLMLMAGLVQSMINSQQAIPSKFLEELVDLYSQLT